MKTANNWRDPIESSVEITTKWVLATLLLLIMTLGITSESLAISTPSIDQLLAMDGAAADEFGFSVSIDGDTAVVGARFDDPTATTSGSAYVYVRDGGGIWSEQAKLTAIDGAQFGNAISISGDTVVIGAAFSDLTAGAAYVFVRNNNGNWNQQIKLTAGDGQIGDLFGISASIDGNTVVIGAFRNNNATGAAYVYVRNNSGIWNLQEKLIADDPVAGASFGNFVSISGDTVVIGAFEDEDNGSASGAAYVFVRSGISWSQQAKLLADDGAVDDSFGNTVSISGNTAVIGGVFNDDDGFNSGSAYVFVRNGMSWSQQAKLLASDAGPVDFFGNSVSISGNIAVIGAVFEDENGDDSGSAYVFRRNGSGDWNEETKLVADDGLANDQFGFSISIDGYTALVGARYDNGQAGSAYPFDLNIPPIAENDTAGPIDSATAITIDVPDNDSDSDGFLDLTSVMIGTAPNHGMAIVDPVTGEIEYTHDGSTTTNDSFTYTIDDDEGLTSNLATVNITINIDVAQEGLIAHWLLDEGMGTTANDNTGNGNDGTLTNAPTWNNNQLFFDGVDDYVNVGTFDVPGSALTLMSWAESNNLQNCSFYDCRILSKASGTATQEHYWMLSTIKVGSDTRLRFRLKAGGSTSTLVASSGDISNNEFFHVAATYDGTTMRLYKDGVLVGSLAKTGSIDGNSVVPAWIGGNPTVASSRPWQGLLADVRVFNKALSTGEVNTVKDSYNMPVDNTPPVLSNIQVVVTDTTAIISWDTDEPSDSAVNYGMTAGYGSTETDTPLVSSHSLTLTGLTANTEYHYQVGSSDASANSSASMDQTFTTAAMADITSPIVSNVNVVVTDSTAVITWTTDEPATGAADYGETNSYGSNVVDTNPTLGTNHSVTLTGLAADTEYHYDVMSFDAAGNQNALIDRTFTTDVAPDPGTDLVAHWLLDEGAGTTANDDTGNGHDGTLINGPIWNGNQLLFDGVDDYINVGTFNVTGSELTLMSWVQSDMLENCSFYDCRILSKASGTAAQDHYWMISTIKVGSVTRLRFRLKAGGVTSTLVASSGNISNDELFHVAATYDGTTMRLYKNGVDVGSQPKTGTIDGNSGVPAWIGGNPIVPNSRPWQGLLADVRIYQTALSTGEVNTVIGNFVDETPPVISNVNVVVTDSTAVITWTTDDPSSGSLEYGLDNTYLSGTVFDTIPGLVTNHSVTLTGLMENTVYHYDLLSVNGDGFGNPPLDRTFTTDPSTGTGGDLIGQWPLNEGSGTTAFDSSTNANDGTLVNGPTWNGNDLWFDGVNDYVNVGTLDVPGSELTLMSWAQSDSLENCSFYDCRIFSKASGTAEQDHYWMLSTIKVGSETRLRFRLKAGGVTSTLVASFGDISNDQLFHAAATYDGTTMRLYLNGVEVGMLAKTGTIDENSGVPAWLGGNPTAGNSRPWSGVLADAQLHQRALSAAEILGIFLP